MRKAIAIFFLAALVASCNETPTENVESAPVEEVTNEVDTTDTTEEVVEADSTEVAE
jgi:hypothetical protein